MHCLLLLTYFETRWKRSTSSVIIDASIIKRLSFRLIRKTHCYLAIWQKRYKKYRITMKC